jgi:DNA-binding transcriptional MerR regulator
MVLQVKDVSELAGVSVRTLHHYDAIGLLTPSSTTTAGYRIYSERDLELLQQIMFFKEIGFSLQEVKEILESPGFNRTKALQAHRELLMEKRERVDRMIRTVDNTIQSIEGGKKMENNAMFEGFDRNKIKEQQEKYGEEARQKYGKEIVDAAEQRINSYSDEKLTHMNKSFEDIYTAIAARMDYGPSDPKAQEGVRAWHEFIKDGHFECTLEMFRGLGDMYVADERFTANIDKFKPGLAQFMKEAMNIYCDRMESKTNS